MKTQDSTGRKTPLYENHVRRGAKMVPFGGWEMPLQFGKVLEEHHAVRNAAGLFDIAHMGLLAVTGPYVETTRSALDALVPQDLSKLVPGKAVYTQILNETGGILDDIIVYQLPSLAHFAALTQWLVICNASNTGTVCQWLGEHLPKQVDVQGLNSRYSLFALQGPTFEAVLKAAGLIPQLPLPKRFCIAEYTLSGMPVLLSRTGYTGEDGVEILVAAEYAEGLWDKLLAVGTPLGLLPIGLAARDTLRLEAAYPLHGAELTPEISPLEAGLGWSVKLGKAADFVGKQALLTQQAHGLTRHFICFKALKKSIPRQHDLIYDKAGTVVGEVTSGSISPTLETPIGVGYIQCAHPPAPGDAYQVAVRGNRVDVVLVARPFYPQAS